MFIYYGGIIFCMAVIAALNYFFAAPVFGFGIWEIIGAVCLTVAAVIVVDLIFAGIVRWILPQKWFSVTKKGFSAGKKECRFYEKIGIKKWKDKIPELGKLTNFRKNKISEPTNNEYVARYITEANYGIGVHVSCIIFGFLVMLIYPEYWYCIGLPVGVVNVVYNCLSLFILRYNLPKLHTLYRVNEKRAARKAAEERKNPQSEKEKEAAATAEEKISD